ncbi:hypothetical protein B0H17DRAFT_576256 [Mycena rosella]|uniref:Uncharacterized protein n=1 Tax=Mycena rosella TaxID=1033263 RepID=A0AAD7FKH6_MYCRO|nr:hypothetical protein B0H17DRAFT_576256 [Mycena rosella]
MSVHVTATAQRTSLAATAATVVHRLHRPRRGALSHTLPKTSPPRLWIPDIARPAHAPGVSFPSVLSLIFLSAKRRSRLAPASPRQIPSIPPSPVPHALRPRCPRSRRRRCRRPSSPPLLPSHISLSGRFALRLRDRPRRGGRCWGGSYSWDCDPSGMRGRRTEMRSWRRRGRGADALSTSRKWRGWRTGGNKVVAMSARRDCFILAKCRVFLRTRRFKRRQLRAR